MEGETGEDGEERKEEDGGRREEEKGGRGGEEEQKTRPLQPISDGGCWLGTLPFLQLSSPAVGRKHCQSGTGLQ